MLFSRLFTKLKTPDLKPIVFVNSPLENNNDDVIGLKPIIKSITEVISKGANIIGIIANYGSGKSSLIELLSKEKGFYKHLISINMWDCLSKRLSSNDDNLTDTISNLTKSFLYQLASGHANRKGKSNLAKYTNKRLSKKYGVISFCTTSWILWLFFGLSALTYALYLVLNNSSILWINNILGQSTFDILMDLSPSFVVVSIILIIFGLRNTTLVYSYWKNQIQNEPDINDIYEIYSNIAIKLYNRNKNKIKLIIIEDLDRISDKKVVFDFLRELYRFNSLLNKKLKKKLVFIISIMPESELLNTNLKEDKNVFAKFFDYSINLKPIHVEDYEAIIISIIKNSGYEKQFMKLINEKNEYIEDKLPLSFIWLTKGHNLSIRDLKDRLNKAINLYITLKNKNYEDVGISFSSCSAVTYLESKYEKEYYKIIKKEDEFADIIRRSYEIRNQQKSSDDRHKEIQGLLQECELIDNNFIKDIAQMILSGEIDDDFRMYFYSYPKESYIKTSDEKDVIRLLLYPFDNNEDILLDEKIYRILEKYNKNEQHKNVIVEAFERVNREIIQGMNSINFPPIILQNEYLFNTAWKINKSQTLTIVCQEIRWNKESFKESSLLFNKIYSYSINKIEKEFLSSYFIKFLKQIINIEPKLLIEIRKELIHILGNDIVYFKDAFYAPRALITESELQAIKDISIVLLLIDVNLVNDKTIGYIAERINTNSLNDNYESARQLLITVSSKLPHQIIAKYLLDFLNINNSIDEDIFTVIADSDLKKTHMQSIIQYVKSLPINSIPNLYYQQIDKLLIGEGLSKDIIIQLEKRELYHSYICTLYKDKKLNEIEYTNERIQELIIKACKNIVLVDENILIELRLAIIKTAFTKIDMYLELFMEEYPLISADEINYFESFQEASMYINKAKLKIENCDFLIDYINKKERNIDECYAIFEMFDPNLSVALSNNIIKKVVENIDFKYINFAGMPIKNKEKACQNISAAIGLSNADNAIAFMQRVKTLVPTLENIVIKAGQTDKYKNLINVIDKPTEKTKQWLLSTPTIFALSPNNVAILLNNNQFDKYIIGKTLYDEKFTFNTDLIDPSVYVSVFNSNDILLNAMSEDKGFLEYIVNNKLFIGMDKKRLKLLYATQQTADLLEVMMNSFNEKEKYEYLKNIPDINFEESKRITKYIKKGDNIMKLDTNNIRKILHSKLNYRYKAVYTRFLNEKYSQKG